MGRQIIQVYQNRQWAETGVEVEPGKAEGLDVFNLQSRTGNKCFIFKPYAELNDAEIKVKALRSLGHIAHLVKHESTYGAMVDYSQHAMSNSKELIINGKPYNCAAESPITNNTAYKISKVAYLSKDGQLKHGSYIEFRNSDKERNEKELVVRIAALKLLGVQAIRCESDGKLAIFTPTEPPEIHKTSRINSHTPGTDATDKVQVFAAKKMTGIGSKPLYKMVTSSPKHPGALEVRYVKSHGVDKDSMKLEVRALHHLGVPVNYHTDSSGEFFINTPELGPCDAFGYFEAGGLTQPKQLNEFLSAMPALVEQLLELERAGLVAGDIKPENIIVSRDPKTKQLKLQIIDPAAAYIGSCYTRSGGTPGYMASERLSECNGAHDAEDLTLATAKVQYAIEELAITILALAQESKITHLCDMGLQDSALPIHFGFYVEAGDARQNYAGKNKTLFRSDLAMKPFYNILARMVRASATPVDHYNSFADVLADFKAAQKGTYTCRPISDEFTLTEFFTSESRPMSTADYNDFKAGSTINTDTASPQPHSSTDTPSAAVSPRSPEKRSHEGMLTSDGAENPPPEPISIQKNPAHESTTTLKTAGFYTASSSATAATRTPSTPKAPLSLTTAHNTPPRPRTRA